MNSVVLLFTTSGRIFMHTHTFTHRLMRSCRQLVAGAMAEEPCQGASTAPGAVLTAQLLLTVILLGTCMRPREKCWALPHPLCFCCACFRHYDKFSERMLCFFKAWGISCLRRPSLQPLCGVWCPMDICGCWSAPSAVGSRCCPNTGTHLSLPQQCGASVISVDTHRGDIR